MKNKIKNSILVTFLLLLTVQVNAQDKGTFRVSAGVMYGSLLQEPGLNIGAEYLISSRFSAAPSYTNYLIRGEGDLSQINIDARYYLLKGKLQVYGLGGYGSFRVSASLGGSRFTVSEGGINLGAGIIRDIDDRLSFNAQVKFVSQGEEGIVQAGLVYRLK